MSAAPRFLIPADVISAHGALKTWLFDHALPFWATSGHEGALGASEHLRLDGSSADVPYKRVRVQARQIYVFSQAALMGWPDGTVLARQGYDFLVRFGERETGGWVRQLSPTGEVIDDAVDLYDQAFVLFALAWYYRLTGDPRALARAHRTTAWIGNHMQARHGGFLNVIPFEPGPRQQNPHMHLLEAMLALYETTGDDYFVQVAHELVDLFRKHLFDPKTGTLGEFFQPDWSPTPGPAGDHIEPGHHYEWVWLLDQYSRLTGVSLPVEMDHLYRFARRFGEEPETALVWDVVDRFGHARRRSARLWPQTEALKAHAVMARRGFGGVERIPLVVDNLINCFFRGCPKGAWIDQFDASRRPIADTIPTSTLYHILMGYAELERLVRT